MNMRQWECRNCEDLRCAFMSDTNSDNPPPDIGVPGFITEQRCPRNRKHFARWQDVTDRILRIY